MIRQPRHSEALGNVIDRLLQVAADLYQRADSGLARLPSGCRPAMYAARQFYAGIGDVISRRGHDSISSRAVVPGHRKMRLVLEIPRVFLMAAPHLDHPPLPETEFLIDAANLGVLSAADIEAAARGENSVVRVLELFEELHRREAEANGLGARD